jgi:two-component system, OmpR family, sensor histidine kinase VicK
MAISTIPAAPPLADRSDCAQERDATESLERQLADTRRRVAELEDFLERAAEGLHMVGPDGTILWANQAELDMLGYAREEYVGRKIQEFHVDPDVVGDFMHRLLRGETMHSRPARLWCRDGSIKHVAVSSNGLFREGDFVCTRCFTRDITRERQAEIAQARLAAIIESSDDAIISKTLDGTITSWNAAAESMYGYTAAEIEGSSVMTIVPPELRTEEEKILERLSDGERIEHFQTVRLTKGGQRLDVSITISPVRDVDGRVIGASKIARDISAQVEAQRRKDQFLAILAHELRNPLAPVRNALAIFRQPTVSAEQRERAQQIAERQTEHMARLLDDLLDVSRITSGRVELKKRRFALKPLLEHSAEAVRDLITAKGHTLALHLSPEDVWLDADPVRIQQIVTNLLTNAAKYTDAGGAIELASVVERNEVLITVSDNGIGFLPEDRARLFTLFSQAASAGHRTAGGLGIGLALVREFVERHGGTVEARSDGPLLGSTFTVRLPCQIRTADA